MTVIRVVLAVLLSTAILSIALPAADTARSQQARTLAAAETEALAAAAERLARQNDPVAPATGGATTLVEVRVPRATTVRVRGGLLVWTHRGQSRRVATAVHLAGEARLAPGQHRLRLSLQRRAGEPVVTVRRFKSDHAATASRVRSSLGVPRVSV